MYIQQLRHALHCSRKMQLTDSKLVLQRCDCNGEGIDAAEQFGAPKGNTPLMASEEIDACHVVN